MTTLDRNGKRVALSDRRSPFRRKVSIFLLALCGVLLMVTAVSTIELKSEVKKLSTCESNPKSEHCQEIRRKADQVKNLKDACIVPRKFFKARYLERFTKCKVIIKGEGDSPSTNTTSSVSNPKSSLSPSFQPLPQQSKQGDTTVTVHVPQDPSGDDEDVSSDPPKDKVNPDPPQPPTTPSPSPDPSTPRQTVIDLTPVTKPIQPITENLPLKPVCDTTAALGLVKC